MAAHGEYMKGVEGSTSKARVATKPKEPQFSGMPFTELMTILNNEKVDVPKGLASDGSSGESSVFTLFFANARTFANGVQSNSERDTAAGFLYQEVGLRLLPYGLVQFEKLPAAQAKWFKRLIVSPEGNKFILHCNRIFTKNKKGGDA
jgi:hypothetical protein